MEGGHPAEGEDALAAASVLLLVSRRRINRDAVESRKQISEAILFADTEASIEAGAKHVEVSAVQPLEHRDSFVRQANSLISRGSPTDVNDDRAPPSGQNRTEREQRR